jgi:hypothetical protein
VHFLYPLLAIVLLIGGMILAALVLQYWMILLALAAAWSVMIMLMTRLLFNSTYRTAVARWYQEQRSTVRTRRAPTAVRFPETPMPATPLIRVLETIDLSQTDMENFMDDPGESQAETEPSTPEQNQHSNCTNIHHLP